MAYDKGIGLEAGVFKATRLEMRYSKEGKPFTSFGVPYNVVVGGEKRTVWINCVVFGQQAEFLHKNLATNGRVHIKSWELQLDENCPALPEYKNEPQWKAIVHRAEVVDWGTQETKEETPFDSLHEFRSLPPEDDIPF